MFDPIFSARGRAGARTCSGCSGAESCAPWTLRVVPWSFTSCSMFKATTSFSLGSRAVTWLGHLSLIFIKCHVWFLLQRKRGGGLQQIYYHDCSGKHPRSHHRGATVAQVGIDLATNCIQFCAIVNLDKTSLEILEGRNTNFQVQMVWSLPQI